MKWVGFYLVFADSPRVRGLSADVREQKRADVRGHVRGNDRGRPRNYRNFMVIWQIEHTLRPIVKSYYRMIARGTLFGFGLGVL